MITVELYGADGPDQGLVLATVQLPCVPRPGDDVLAGDEWTKDHYVVAEGPAGFVDGRATVSVPVRSLAGVDGG